MRVRTSPIDPAHVYPCSKRDVREAFGEELLESAWFGLIPDFHFDSRATHRPKIVGIVPMEVTVDRENVASLVVYRVPRELDTVLFRSRLRALMRGEMRPWAEGRVARTETQILGYESLIVELRDGLFVTHELRFL